MDGNYQNQRGSPAGGWAQIQFSTYLPGAIVYVAQTVALGRLAEVEARPVVADS